MVTKKPKGLGRGLEALLGPKAEDAPAASTVAQSGVPTQLRLEQMVAGMYQPRTRMDEGALYELAESIKAQGIMQPILVRQLSKARTPANTKSSPASGASAPASWRGWRACPCWCVMCPTRPLPPWP